MWKRGIQYVIALLVGLQPAVAAEIRVAVASNFAGVAEALARQFEAETEHQVILVPGSTGKHYAQIRNGAPFDLFFAADMRRPERLEKEGLAIAGSRFTYARGNLVLWSPAAVQVDDEGEILQSDQFHHLAMANPDLAPYGRAAAEVLNRLGVAESLNGRIVRGENIGQTFQFVASGNAELGFVALSQILGSDGTPPEGTHWRVPPDLHSPIDQQAVLLVDTAENREFLEFVATEEAQSIIRQHGYSIP